MTGSTKLLATEVVNSLTGYDEQKIEQHFGAPVEALGGAKFIRALLFGYFLHQGVEAKTAHKQVMNLTQVQVSEYFADEEDADGDNDEAGAAPAPPGGAPPVTELGHGGYQGPAAVDAAADSTAADVATIERAAGPAVPLRPVSDAPQA